MYNYIEMKEELSRIHQTGVELYLDGLPSTPDAIAMQCVKEEGVYMADYVLNDEGHLKELRYDKVTM